MGAVRDSAALIDTFSEVSLFFVDLLTHFRSAEGRTYY